ncbi:uncharacterized protein EURHEDRAFT_376077 [Aspergillus ruber CBS 135680]|uniref:Uncharacterized protein n=1 Tax=Aspergillus ruber (strain CBS 135680) TaxID=1388766 RepID=A0A017SJ54_ASPRC|nr:uncharacterized protein EURHEDRAFT_376077 [Aspergillus ruber CBS 135680]EYE96791.1 hypothetical protein EURHEDRAFT_376077 [Aspergillus ruber CBS 135680]
MSGAQVINVDPYGPSTEFVSVHRRRLITQILKAIRRDKVSEGHGRGKFQFPSATWFSLWLSDMDCLEEVATAFDQNPRRVSGLYTMTGSFGRWPWFPNLPAAPESSPKRHRLEDTPDYNCKITMHRDVRVSQLQQP